MERGVGTVWSQACATLRGELGEAAFGSWIAHAKLRCDRSGALVVVTPTGIARDWIRRNAWKRIHELWSRYDPEHRALSLKSRSEFDSEEGSGEGPSSDRAPKAGNVVALAGARAATVSAVAAEEPEPAVALPPPCPGLQERLKFETFVQGPSNEFAFSVARRVAAWAEGWFNPVVFHGPYGFGKTHLLNAIAWEAGRARPDKKIVYLTAEQFTSGFLQAIRDRSGAAQFKGDLRGADLLLVDDIHFLGGKKSSEEEFFHTLTALMGEGKRVVFTADRPPSALTELDARLRSHLGAGLVCGVEPADHALRVGILERKAGLLVRELGLKASLRPEVLQFLAERFRDSIREMEGGLNTLVARAGERLPSLTLEEAQGYLALHLRGGERRISVDEIQRAVAEHYGMKKDDLLSERRTRAVARPRQLAMYLCKQLTTRSYPDIGRRFGGRDHTTVLHAVRRIEALKAEDAALAKDAEIVTRRLKEA